MGIKIISVAVLFAYGAMLVDVLSSQNTVPIIGAISNAWNKSMSTVAGK